MSKMLSIVLLALISLSGCSWIMPKLDKVEADNRSQYKKSKSLPDLEVPPDLTTEAIRDRMSVPEAGGTAKYSTYQERIAERKQQQSAQPTPVSQEHGGADTAATPPPPLVPVAPPRPAESKPESSPPSATTLDRGAENKQRDDQETSANEGTRVLDNEHIMAVSGTTAQLWPVLVDLMKEHNYALALNDQELGVIETNWIENEKEGHREKYKIFAEPGENLGATVLYVSNRAESLVQKDGEMVWQPKTRDAARENQLVAQIQRKLGTGAVPGTAKISAASADAMPALTDVVISTLGKVSMLVSQDFSTAWRSMGVALERAGYDIDHYDRDTGTYYIRIPLTPDMQQPRTAWLDKLAFWRSDKERKEVELQINLNIVGTKTEVLVLDKKGRSETDELSKKILDRLSHEINKLAS